MSRLWCRFLDWLTKRRIAYALIESIGYVDGPVRTVHKLHDQFIVLTDRNVYAVRFAHWSEQLQIRRVA